MLRPVAADALLVPGPAPLLVKARILSEVLGTYVRVRRLMHTHDVAAVADALRRPAAPAPDPRESVRLGRRLASPIMRSLAIGPWDSRCLMRSLILIAMLNRRGVHADLVIGVEVADGFKAHAWVESTGVALLPKFGYAELTRI